MTDKKLNILSKPSFYAQVISGFIILYCFYSYFIDKSGNTTNLMMLFLLGISLSVHSIWHLLMERLLPKRFAETNYNFNPIEFMFN